MSVDLMKQAATQDRDEGQRRMDEAAERVLSISKVHARIHEFDENCQNLAAERM